VELTVQVLLEVRQVLSLLRRKTVQVVLGADQTAASEHWIEDGSSRLWANCPILLLTDTCSCRSPVAT